MSSCWQQIAALARRDLRRQPAEADDSLSRAFYFLDYSDALDDEMTLAIRGTLERTGNWEVLMGPTLHRLPDLLLHAPDEYQLIVIYVANEDIASRHDAILRTLSGEFSFLIVINAVTSMKTQCPLLSLTANAHGSLLTVFSWFALQLPRSSASQVTEIGQDELRLSMSSHPASQASWGKWLDGPASCQIAARYDGETRMSRELIRNSIEDLSHLFPSSQSVSWVEPPQHYFHVSLRFEPSVTQARRLSILESLCTSNNDNGGVSIAWTFKDGALLQVGEAARMSRSALLAQLGGRYAGIVTLHEAVRVEIQGCRLSTYAALAYVVNATAIDPDTGLVVDSLRYVPPPPPQLHRAVDREPPLAAQPPVAGVEPVAAPVPPVVVTTPLPLPPPPPPAPSVNPEDEKRRLKEVVSEAVTAALAPVLEEMNRTISTTRREVDETVQRLEQKLHSVTEEVRHALDASAAASASAADASVFAVKAELEQLRRDLEVVKESAADQQLVVEAMNDLRARCATNTAVNQLEARLVRVVQANQELTESAHVAVASCRSHVEANSAEVETIMRRVEMLHHQSLDATLESSVSLLSKRVSELSESVRYCESNVSNAHASVQESVIRLHSELRAQEAEYTKLVLLQRQAGSRLDGLQDSLARFDSKIAGVVDEAVAATSHARLHQLQEQVQSIKAYTAASVDRQSQLHSEQLSNVERKLTADVQRVAEVLRKQQSSELDRIREDVHKLHKHVSEIATAAPANLKSAQAAAAQSTSNAMLGEEMKMYKEKCDQLWKEQEALRSRVRQVEVVQTEVSDFVSTEGERREQQDDLIRRVEDLESSLIFLEGRLS